MIPNATLILGPPGTGKTTYLIGKIEEALQEGVSPSRIGVISFTRKAIEEMVSRACSKFNLTPKDFPHLRTSHSTGYHGLGLQARDVMSKLDYSEIGKMVGLSFKGQDTSNMDEGSLINSLGGSGGPYLAMCDRARNKMITLDEEYNRTGDHSIFYPKLVQLYEQCEIYKAENQKFDFVDMIEKYIELCDAPHLDLLLVDEGQDFTRLQWELVKKMAANSQTVYIAGDDDQAIHRWAAADVSLFTQSAKDRIVLDQSYRIPKQVHALSKTVADRISNRLPKVFHPREEEGRVEFIDHLGDVNFDEGQFAVMARVNSYVRELAKYFETAGYKYEIKGRSSIPDELVENLMVWEDLRKGEKVSVERLKKFYSAVPKQGKRAVVQRGANRLLEALAPDDVVEIGELQRDFGLKSDASEDPYDVLRVSTDMRMYINSIVRRGESLLSPPRIKLSTFHAMKGGEADNCVVYLGSTYSCVNTDYPSDEHRAFYVALTRAKEKLYVLNSNKEYRYDI
jgi:superfamily I DNA/RNA helicase